MREIIFRAKRLDNHEWIQGYYYKISEAAYCFKEDYEKKPVPVHHYIVFSRMVDWGLPNQLCQARVDPDTLCEYTGLKDKNGTRIWENDVLFHEGEYALIKFGTYEANFASTQNHGFYADFSDSSFLRKDLGYWALNKEIVGNIFDNPELLKRVGTNK